MRKAVYRSVVLSIILIAAVGSVVGSQESRKNLVIVPASGPLKGKAVYANSHALLIGVNRYPGLPGKDLQFALNDVRDVADIMVKSYGFRPQNVRILTDSQATLAGIKAALVDLADSRRVGPEDRVLVYFSGHGQTVKLAGGGEMGFLIPHDARVDLNDFQNAAPYLGTCLPMSQLWDYLGPSAAKHILVAADACYSGLLAQSRGGRERISEESLAQLAATRARQVMTAGQKGQVSFELAQVGHGAFTGKLLERLKARAAEDDVFTAAELHADVQIAVSNLSKGRQQPIIGSYETEGQFLFIPTAYTGPAFSAQSLIGEPAKLPVAVAPEKPKAPISTPPAGGASRTRRVGAIEITVPAGWEIDTESGLSAGLYKPELKDAANPAEWVKVFVRDVSRLWRHRPSSSWQDMTKTLIDEALRSKSLIQEDGGYAQSKSSQGVDMLARKTLYRQGSAKIITWDHVGLRSGTSLALLYVQSPSRDYLQKLEPEIQQILNGIRFVTEP